MTKIELLAPAKDYASGVAAVDCGADALYIGGAQFGARYAAANSTEDIAQLVEYAHAYGVKVYATINTIIYENELNQARTTAQELTAAGVDALIVQDMSLLRMGLEGVEMHASTQTCNTTVEGVRFLQECGFARVILERGLSLDQIKEIRTGTDVDLECFVHGAICVGNSGQCYLSRSMGSRSGNRGECSQPCRLPYDLMDEHGAVVMGGKHLLSVKDMNLAPKIEELLEAGVTSFKIEGRLKDVGYVRNVVGYYRRVLDAALLKRKELVRSSYGESRLDFEPDPRRSFTRAGSLYFIDGKRSGVASMESPKALGTFIGKVTKVDSDSFDLSSTGQNPLSAGDGICFFSDGELLGTNINRVVGKSVYPNRMDSIARTMDIYRNYDHLFSQSLERSKVRRSIAVKARVELSPKEVVLSLRDIQGVEVRVSRQGEFDVAQNPEKMVLTLQTQVSKSGDTIFNVTNVDVRPAKPCFVPVSMIADMRRQALEELYCKRCDTREQAKVVVENMEAKFPSDHIDGSGNVVNSLAESFYRDHGVEQIEQGFDKRDSLRGEVVMTTPYCIRREIGQCLKKSPKLRGDLRLMRGAMQYLCVFDCVRCEMKLVKEK